MGSFRAPRHGGKRPLQKGPLRGIPRFVPICSDFFRFVFRTNQNESGKPLSADFFCKDPENSHSLLELISDFCTIRHENITYPKKLFSNYFPITVSRFRFLRINFRKLPDTYCICVSCVTLPGWDPCPFRIIFYYRYPI